MEAGIIELAPVFKGSTSTTAAEMKEYMQGVVDRFCGVTGLVVIETVDHEKGAFFIIGEKEKTQGLLAIGNTSHAVSHYQTFVLSTLGPSNEIRTGMGANNVNSGDGQTYTFFATPVWMKYIKTDNGIVIGLKAASTPAVSDANTILHKIRNENSEELFMFRIYNQGVFASYNPLLLNDKKDVALFALSGYNKNLIPADKEATAEIYLESGVGLPGTRLYTNKKQAEVWNKVRISGLQYIVVSKGTQGGNFALIMQVSDMEPQT